MKCIINQQKYLVDCGIDPQLLLHLKTTDEHSSSSCCCSSSIGINKVTY